ncbi:MAG: M23 family metallopeptidase, partial [Fimbriimonadaceae bacterium]|nr:M23 family metallopeptidase [Fimbriimonadaceae bacterium]
MLEAIAAIVLTRPSVTIEPYPLRTFGMRMPPPISPLGTAPLPDTWVRVPMIFPVVGTVRWQRTYNQNRGAYRHTGEDLLAPKFSPVVAPFDGFVAIKPFSFWIYGDNGYRCLGTHMNEDTPGTNDDAGNPDFMFAPGLRTGDRVVAGQLIGYVGDSTNATAPHLHFELHGPQGVISPRPSLKYAQRIARPFAALALPDRVPPVGQVRYDGELRRVDADVRVLTLLLTAKKFARGPAIAVAKPSYFRVRLPEELWAEWELRSPDAVSTRLAVWVIEGTDRDTR